MTASQSLLIAIETFASILFIWGLIHEEKLIAFEKWITMVVTVNHRRRKRRKLAQKIRKSEYVQPNVYNPMSVYDEPGKVA